MTDSLCSSAHPQRRGCLPGAGAAVWCSGWKVCWWGPCRAAGAGSQETSWELAAAEEVEKSGKRKQVQGKSQMQGTCISPWPPELHSYRAHQKWLGLRESTWTDTGTVIQETIVILIREKEQESQGFLHLNIYNDQDITQIHFMYNGCEHGTHSQERRKPAQMTLRWVSYILEQRSNACHNQPLGNTIKYAHAE